MKKSLAIMLIAVLTIALFVGCKSEPEAKTYKVGDRGPAGGTVFYVADSEQTSNYVDADGKTVSYTWKYLEVAPSDLTVTSDETTTETFTFGLYLVPNGSGLSDAEIVTTENDDDGTKANADIGQGRYNTTMLVYKMGSAYTAIRGGSTTDNYAAKLCTTYDGGGYSDWFLPSLNELKEVYKQYAAGKIVGTWHTKNESGATGKVDSYWSSSELNSLNALTLKFSDGGNWNTVRSSSVSNTYLRPIRAFI